MGVTQSRITCREGANTIDAPTADRAGRLFPHLLGYSLGFCMAGDQPLSSDWPTKRRNRTYHDIYCLDDCLRVAGVWKPEEMAMGILGLPSAPRLGCSRGDSGSKPN